MNILESNLNCQGICKPTMFWFFRPITEGQPPRSCAVAVKETFDETFGALAWGLTATTIVSFSLLMCTCGLCRKRKKTANQIEFDVIDDT